MTGYTRQSTALIQPGLTIPSGGFNAEFNQIQAAFDAITGHAHDGSTGSAPRVNLGTSVTGNFTAPVGIGMVPINVLDITQNQNAGSIMALLNSSSGTGAFAQLALTNGTSSIGLTKFGTGYTTAGLNRADGTQLFAGGAGGLTLVTGAAQPIYFGTNNVQVATFDANGQFGQGATPSAWGGTYKAHEFTGGYALAANATTINLAANAVNNGTNWTYKTTAIAAAYTIGSTGTHTWFNAVSGTAGTAISFTQGMQLDASSNLSVAGGVTVTGSATITGNLLPSSNIGMNTAPSAWGSTFRAVEFANANALFGTSSVAGLVGNASNNNTNWLYKTTNPATQYTVSSAGAHQWYNAPSGTAGNVISFTQAMILDANGNLGIGATPSTWGTAYRTVEFAGGNSHFATSTLVGMVNNASNNGTNWIYKTSNPAALFQMTNAGVQAWYNAASGTAGNTVSFTQQMTLAATGHLLLGTTSDNGTDALQVNGSTTATVVKSTGMAKVLATVVAGAAVTNATTVLSSWTTSFDTGSNFNAATGIFTAPATGYYLVSSSIAYAGNFSAGQTVTLQINVNGSVVAANQYSAGTTTTQASSITALVQANSGQPIKLQITTSAGSTVSVINSTTSFLSITQVV